MSDKRLSLDELVGGLSSGMTIGIGGWGSRRKPMAAVRAILRSDLTDLTVVSYGGPDVGLLCAAGKVAKAVYGFVTLDSIPTDPHFKAARQSGAIEAMEVDEGMFYLGLLAASQRVPFLPTRSGLGSDVLTVNPSLRTVRSPYDDGEELVAMPALRLDAAIVHVNRADASGSGQILGPDPFFDELFLGAADRRFVTTERIVPTDELATGGPLQSLCISRLTIHINGDCIAHNYIAFLHCPGIACKYRLTLASGLHAVINNMIRCGIKLARRTDKMNIAFTNGSVISKKRL